MYEVNNYTDDELIEILDINNPTDRELEAKIVSMIAKYKDRDTDEISKLYKFFNDIYHRLFENVEGYDDEDGQIEGEGEGDKYEIGKEGYEGNDTTKKPEKGGEDGGGDAVETTSTPIVGTGTGGSAIGEADITYTHGLKYTSGNVNPILKETINRVVSIDSQYRNRKIYPYSTDFTFSLTDTLRNVVSIRLYSYQIPYSWYTINDAMFGSNFFYIKGNTPGLDTGSNDYKITISSGTRTTSGLIDDIQTVLSSTLSDVSDVDWGETEISFNKISSRATIKLDVTNIYNETRYYIDFPYTDPSNSSGESLQSFFGYNYKSYYPGTIVSDYLSSFPTNRFIITDTNRTFTIYNYLGTDEFDSDLSADATYVFNTIDVSLSLSAGNYYATDIFADLNTQLQNNIYLDTTKSAITAVDVSNISSTYNICFHLHIVLNRKTTVNKSNMKTVVVFPSTDTTLWLTTTSCFQFLNSTNETSNIISETPNTITTYSILTNAYALLTMTSSSEYTTTANEYRFDVSNNSTTVEGYSLTEYLAAIQTGMDNVYCVNTEDTSLNTIVATIDNTNTSSLATMTFNINGEIPGSEFEIDISMSVLSTLLLLSPTTLSGDETITSSPSSTSNSYVINDENDTIKIYCIGVHNTGISELTISLTQGSYSTISKLVDEINLGFTNFTTDNSYGINTNSTKLAIDTTTTANTVNCSFVSKIVREITENDYTITLYDDNGTTTTVWNTFLFFDSSYVLSEYINGNLASVSGTDTIYGNELYVDASSNHFYVKAVYDASGGVYTSTESTTYSPPSGEVLYYNDIMITLSDLTIGSSYTREVVIAAINAEFTKNTILTDSSISLYDTVFTNTLTNSTGTQKMTKLRLNVAKIFRASDYRLVFYDTESFTRCDYGPQSSVHSVTSDTTLGWILGFRDNLVYYFNSEYIIFDVNLNYSYYIESPNTVYSVTDYIFSITGDTTVSVNIYNYFLILLDDYVQNHLNDGLVTIATTVTDIELPSYAKTYVCNPADSTVSISNSLVEGNNLTINQIYSANQIMSSKTKTTTSSSGPFVQDIFGLIPLKISGLSPTDSLVEYGGTIQQQERTYFGPVNIHKFRIQLVSDKGLIVNLNNHDWSCSFIVTQLYTR